MRLSDLQEGMGGSSGGGTAGSAGAGGSSLGLPYPSTYEEENDKFKYRSPVQKQMSLTTEDEDKLWKRDELPQLNLIDFEESEYTLEELKVSIDKLKPVQNERVPGLVKKTIGMLKDGKEKPIVVDKFGYIVNGHHRYDAYKKLNIDVVPVIKVNATIEALIDKYM
jgi:hypothetical protein